jgi:hypothetical protein
MCFALQYRVLFDCVKILTIIKDRMGVVYRVLFDCVKILAIIKDRMGVFFDEFCE